VIKKLASIGTRMSFNGNSGINDMNRKAPQSCVVVCCTFLQRK